MKKSIYNLSFLLLLLLTVSLYGQGTITINFSYDASGNRISRYISMKETRVRDSLLLKQTTVVGELTINIYPNPNKGRFTVEIRNKPDTVQAEILLYTISGNLLFDKKNPEVLTTIDIYNREAGIYLLYVVIDNKRETWKIVKE